MTITPDNYLDIGNLVINELFGGSLLFWMVGAALIAYFGVKYHVPLEATYVFIIILSVVALIYDYSTTLLIWMLILLSVGVIIYPFISRLIKR